MHSEYRALVTPPQRIQPLVLCNSRTHHPGGKPSRYSGATQVKGLSFALVVVMADGGFMKIPNVAFDKWEYDPEKLSALLWLARSRDYSTGKFTQGIRALALRYDWSIGKSHRFWHSAVEHFRNSSGTVVEQQRNTKSAPMANLSGSTRTEPEQERNSSGTVVEHIQEEEEDKDKVTTPPIVPQGGRRVKRNGVEYKPDFLTFWNAYPSKVGKGIALKAWEKADVSIAVVLESLEWQRNLPGWTKDGGQFIPHPATYLNQRRWEDEKPPPKRGVFAFLGDDDGEQEG